MNEWISVKDRLPEEGVYCWIHGLLNDEIGVFEGCFTSFALDFSSFPLEKGQGWEYDTDRCDYVMLKDISHWMPYFTPEPPNEKE